MDGQFGATSTVQMQTLDVVLLFPGLGIHSYPHLWSQTISSDWKNKTADTDSWYHIPLVAGLSGEKFWGWCRTHQREYVCQLFWEYLRIPRRSWWRCLWRGRPGLLCSSCQPDLDQWKLMDGRMFTSTSEGFPVAKQWNKKYNMLRDLSRK